jgi:CubicO group peptidase (beta-lactamase class C family)
MAFSAQEGPPVEIRQHVQALVAAYNSGSAGQWEEMVQEHFAPAGLAGRSAADRRELLERLRGDFGQTIAVARVTRDGPDAPLKLHVRGASGLEGAFELTLEPAAPFRITRFAVEVNGPGEADEPGMPSPRISGSMTDAELSAALDDYLAKLAADDVFAGVGLVAKNGKPVFEKAYGYADRANRIPNTTATRFNLGSINKAFTRTAVAQLVAQGKLAYSDTLGRLIPDYPQQETRAATIEQLLGHTAGIADFFGDTFNAAPKARFRSNEDYYRLVSNQKPLFPPGARNQYCNGCYITLGAIVQRVSGMPYEAFVAEHVFKPAGMKGTGYPQTDAIEPDVALGYTRRTDDGHLRSNVFTRGAAGSAAGGGYATAADLLAFDNALREGRLLDREASARFLGSPGAETPQRLLGPFGIGGGAPGINAALESDGVWTVVVLTNLDPPTGSRVGQAIYRALAH